MFWQKESMTTKPKTVCNKILFVRLWWPSKMKRHRQIIITTKCLISVLAISSISHVDGMCRFDTRWIISYRPRHFFNWQMKREYRTETNEELWEPNRSKKNWHAIFVSFAVVTATTERYDQQQCITSSEQNSLKSDRRYSKLPFWIVSNIGNWTLPLRLNDTALICQNWQFYPSPEQMFDIDNIGQFVM